MFQNTWVEIEKLEQIDVKSEHVKVRFRKVLKYCPKPCGGRQPCIRTCLCGRGMMSNGNGKCEEMTNSIKEQLRKHDNGTILWQ